MPALELLPGGSAAGDLAVDQDAAARMPDAVTQEHRSALYTRLAAAAQRNGGCTRLEHWARASGCAHEEVNMHRAVILSILFAAAPLGVACEKTGADEQAKANQAQEQANRDIGRANAQATEAQRSADEKIAAAQADFLKLRDDYRVSSTSNLDSIDKQIADLDAKAAGSPNRAKLRAALPAIHAQRDAYASDLHSVDGANAATFDAVKARLDKEWSDLKSAVDDAK